MNCRIIPLALVPLMLVMARGQELTYEPDLSWKAPPAAAAKTNPLTGNPSAAGGGRKLFLRNCAECHGNETAGTGRAPGLHLAPVQEQSDGALFWKITNGNLGRGMPVWSRLPEAQRWQLVLFLRSLRRTGS